MPCVPLACALNAHCWVLCVCDFVLPMPVALSCHVRAVPTSWRDACACSIGPCDGMEGWASLWVDHTQRLLCLPLLWCLVRIASARPGRVHRSVLHHVYCMATAFAGVLVLCAKGGQKATNSGLTAPTCLQGQCLPAAAYAAAAGVCCLLHLSSICCWRVLLPVGGPQGPHKRACERRRKCCGCPARLGTLSLCLCPVGLQVCTCVQTDSASLLPQRLCCFM